MFNNHEPKKSRSISCNVKNTNTLIALYCVNSFSKNFVEIAENVISLNPIFCILILNFRALVNTGSPKFSVFSLQS